MQLDPLLSEVTALFVRGGYPEGPEDLAILDPYSESLSPYPDYLTYPVLALIVYILNCLAFFQFHVFTAPVKYPKS